jgi:predicted DNA-binding transcriptional regulator AlpA
MTLETEYVTAAQVRRRFGDCSRATLHRWLRKDLTFPRPVYLYGRHRYWKAAELARWEKRSFRRTRPSMPQQLQRK